VQGWYEFRNDESVDASEPRGVSGATQAGSQRPFQDGFHAGMEIPGLHTKRMDSSRVEVTVMKTPTMFQWYQILRHNYHFTMFQAVRFALWLAR